MAAAADLRSKYWKQVIMRDAAQRSIKTALFSLLMSAALGSGATQAQSGSAGGSIGNDEKSWSGSREAPRSVEPSKPARRSKPEADEPRRTSRQSGGGGGGGGGFDGAWIVVSVGTTCQGSSTTAVVVSSGKIIGQGVSGRVGPNGAASAVGNSNGITIISSGHLSGRSGSGTFKQSDGCVGRWTASKQ
jgi:hypothetical protein